MANIVLYGGSFNPHKAPDQYIDKRHRMAMLKILARHYPDLPLVIIDAHEKIRHHLYS